MHLATKLFLKVLFVSVSLGIFCTSCTNSSASLNYTLDSQNLEITQNDSNLSFETLYDSEEVCDQRNFGFRWKDITSDLKKYEMGMDKINWLFSTSICTQVTDRNYSHIYITEFRDKNSPLYVYYIRNAKNNYRILVKIHRKEPTMPMSEGRREYIGDVDAFPEGKFIIDKFIDTQTEFY